MVSVYFVFSKDLQSKSIESMKGKIDTSEARMEQLVVELSKKTEENQTLKVMQIVSVSVQIVLVPDS